LTNLQNRDAGLTKAIVFHPQASALMDAFMIGVNEVVSGTKSAQEAMSTAAKKANAALP
jgi:multiple sugar transport system substrate-binding protein